jgi:hypothetical protein
MRLLEAGNAIAEIIRDLLTFVGVTAAMLIALLAVSMMPNTNPLKRVLTALCCRLGATLAAGVVALEPISVSREGVTIIYISHRMPEVQAIATRVTVLKDGRSVMTAPLAEVPTGRQRLEVSKRS